MTKKEKNRPNTYTALRTRIAALGLSLWLICMILVTWVAAADMYNQVLQQASQDVHIQFGAQDIPGSEEYRMLLDISHGYTIYLSNAFPLMLDQKPDTVSSSDWFWDETELLYGYEPAMVIRNQYGDILMQTGDYLFFEYTTTKYDPDDETPAAQGYGYIDLNDPGIEMKMLRDFVYERHLGGTLDRLSFYHFSMTGWFEGAKFHPVTVFYNYLDISAKLLFSGVAAPGKELVTIYMEHPWICTRPTTPVSVGGTRFDSLTDLLDAHSSGQGDYRSDNLFNAVIIVTSHRSDQTIYLAYRCCPMGYAALRLIPFYVVTLAMILIALKLILRGIRQNLTEHLGGIISAAAFNAPLTPDAKWEEVYALEQQYTNAQQSLSERNTELQQLRTKLDYAQNAEENRRKLISGLTHELKPPLAVIHSYAEGLQEGIAEDKEDHYLSVILEQSEKMDALVLQMLDLSRLESGKVRLSTDNFSLLELTKTVVERFAPLLESKDLTVRYGVAQDFLITADHGRMEQVITNLVSNAQKYTEPGNPISISVFQHNGTARFSIENPGKWLENEELDKVWDSFFRVDPSRTAPGTGLGLAVVKQIIQLHQGECKVRNVLYKTTEKAETGVQFSFQIPMG